MIDVGVVGISEQLLEDIQVVLVHSYLVVQSGD